MESEREERARVDVLGPLHVQLDGRDIHVGGTKTQALLVTLANHIGEIVRFALLAEAVWGDDQPASARNGLQARVAGLRKTFGRALDIRTSSTGYGLGDAGVSVDVVEFEHLASSAEPSSSSTTVSTLSTRRRHSSSRCSQRLRTSRCSRPAECACRLRPSEPSLSTVSH